MKKSSSRNCERSASGHACSQVSTSGRAYDGDGDLTVESLPRGTEERLGSKRAGGEVLPGFLVCFRPGFSSPVERRRIQLVNDFDEQRGREPWDWVVWRDGCEGWGQGEEVRLSASDRVHEGRVLDELEHR